jgi:hypothetical protein
MAGTTTSSGLNNLLSSTNQQQTTLPSWYDTAQQNVINQAGGALGQAPSFGNTVAQNAVNTLQSPNNPFSQAQNTLNAIGQGSVNAFTTDPTTGVTTPNTNTPLGGLFSAQQQQLNQLLPQITSGAEAGAIGSGNFGSLRGQTAVDIARGNAFDTLAAQQMQSALQNQQTGATAAGSLSNVGAQDISSNLNTGAAQMNAPFQGATNYANLVNAVNAPGTVSVQNQLSPLQMVSQLAGLPSAASNLTSALFGSAGKTGTLANALSNIPGLSGLFTNTAGTPTTTNSGGTATDISNSVLNNTTPADINNINNIVAAGPADPSGGSINGIDISI